MVMPSTGALNMGGTSSPVSVNYELGKASPYNQTVTMNDTDVRTLAGVSLTSGSSWSMNSLYGKANFTVSYTPSGFFDNNTGYDDLYTTGSTGTVALRWNANGTMDKLEFTTGYLSLGVNWGAPTTTGIGSNYWIRFTRTATNSFGSPTAATNSTASTGWLQLSSAREIAIERTPGQHDFSATYTIEISSSSSGSPVLSTRTGIYIVLYDDAI